MAINGIQALNTVLNYSAPRGGRAGSQVGGPAATGDAGTVYDAGKADKAAEIMSGYDLHHISFNERRELGFKLRDAGILNDEQMLDLTGPSVMRMDPNMQPLLDEKLDFAAGVRTGLENARSSPELQKSVPYWERLDSLVESLMAVGGKS